MKYTIVLFCLVFLTSCDLFKIKEKESYGSEIVAIINTDKLFREDLLPILPKNVNRTDSLVLVKSYIQDWAVNKLLLKKAKNNSSLEAVNQIDALVKDYKESLLINNL